MRGARSTGGSTPRERRILIIGINYWPEPTGIAPYTTEAAEHLAEAGYGVDVLCGMPSFPQWRVLDSYDGRWSAREQIRGVNVHRVRHYVGSADAVRRGLYEATFSARALESLRLPRPDAVIGIVPSLSGGVAARIAASRYRVPYGLIIQDLMGPSAAQSGTSGGGRVARITGMVERWAVRGAARVGAVSDGFLPYLRSSGIAAERLTLLPNWTRVSGSPRDRAGARAALGWPADEQIVLHAGTMGAKQGLEQVIDAARIAAERQQPVTFVMLGDGNQRRKLEELAGGLATCRFLDPLAESAFPDALTAADVLLLSERASVQEMCLPSKLTSYFVAGRPVVAMTGTNSAAAREVERSGGGLRVPAGNPRALLSAIECLQRDPERAATLGRAGAAYAQSHLSAAAAFERLDNFVQQLTQSAGRGALSTELVADGKG